MGDGDGAAALDLALEERDDAAGRTEDIAEADGAHAGCGRISVRENFFGDALGGTHDAARVGGFIGGDHGELAGMVFRGDGGKCPGAEDVVADDGDGVLFHERDVFEGGGVEDLGGLEFFENFVEEWGVADVAEDGDELSRRVCDCVCRKEFGIDFVEILFGMVEEKHGSDLIVWRWGVTVEENRGAVYIVASWGAAVSSGRALRVKLLPYMLFGELGIEVRSDELLC